MDTEGRERAASAYRKLMKGKDHAAIAQLAGISDPATVRAFVDGMSWPRAATRIKLEEAAGLEPGDLTLIAYGDKRVDDDEDDDPVVAAIERSALSRANKHLLRGQYFAMLDAQSEASTA